MAFFFNFFKKDTNMAYFLNFILKKYQDDIFSKFLGYQYDIFSKF